jgi:transposase
MKVLKLSSNEEDGPMSEITILAIDLAKHVFQLHGCDQRGRTVLQRQVRRPQLAGLLATLPSCRVVMEACGSAHYWARQARLSGHQAQLINPRYLKAFYGVQKNDRNDAQAIARAARQADTPQVAIKSEEQQGVLALHRLREQYLKQRVALINQLHGLLLEFGIVLPRRVAPLRAQLRILLDEQRVPPLLHNPLQEQLAHLGDIEQRLHTLTRQLQYLAEHTERCQHLMRHRGVGPLTATAFAAELGDPGCFKNGRQVSAWLGLVPRQHCSGQRQRLLGITKAGNSHLRRLLIHGARAVLRHAVGKSDALSQWLLALQQRRGSNRAAVALANKTARRLWATLRYGQAH